jgi:transposase
VFVRQKKNKSGKISIQVILKSYGKFEVIHTLGCSSDAREVESLVLKGKLWIDQKLGLQPIDLISANDRLALDFLTNGLDWIRPAGAELVLNPIFDDIGFNLVAEPMFRYLVLCRLIYPGSKLRTTEYLARHHAIYVDVEAVYRFMDRFAKHYRKDIEQASFDHTSKIMGRSPQVVFYDVTTLYFEASHEDDLRKMGFSKDGKAQNPQIVLGLLVASKGYPLAYEMFEGSKYEGHTMIPVVEAFKKRFKLERLVVVADAGLLSAKNIEQLVELGYDFILGARLKAESKAVKKEILKMNLTDGQTKQLVRPDGFKLIINHSEGRSKNDAFNRARGLAKLEKAIDSGKLGKQHINNRGYNKFLIMNGEVTIELDKVKVDEDTKWDGLKGFVTNTTLTMDEVMDNYKQLWNIEKAFRMSKSDLRFRPIFHRKKSRIETHLCIAFCSYKLYKELERQLQKAKSGISPERAIQILNSVYEIQAHLPESKKPIRRLQVKTEEQQDLLAIFKIQY